MHIFDTYRHTEQLFTPDILRLLMSLQELKGHVSVRMQGAPAVIETLRELARIQSTDASNRIEGIVTTKARLRELMQQKTAPRNRSEEEIAGYRDVLNTVHEHYLYIPPRPALILQMHRDMYAYCGRGGTWKRTDNIISETGTDGVSLIRFEPVPAYRTEEAMDMLCTAFEHAMQEGRIEPLLAIPLFLLDFLCIHPFFDGNGRMSRLLTTLLLHRSGYDIGRYISLEQLVEQTKDGYYGALQSGSVGWHENKGDYTPFIRYFLGILLKAYSELESRMEAVSNNGNKAERVRALFASTLKPLRKSDIAQQCTDISLTTIERVLHALLKEGYLVRIGQGRSTAYIRKS